MTTADSFLPVENPGITILWVIDNSGSMCEEQANLRDNIDEFLDALVATSGGARFHMGVVTTDTLNANQSGRLVNIPQPATMTALCPTPPPPLDCTTDLPNPLPKWVDDSMFPDQTARIFGCLSSVGISGYGGETALGAARMALSPTLLDDPSANGGFLIEDSLLAIIFIGDEDDCSVCSGSSCGPPAGVTSTWGDCSRVNELTPIPEFVAAIEGVADRVLIAAIIGVEESSYAAWCVEGRCVIPVSVGRVPDPSGDDARVPICSAFGVGSATPAPRIEAFARSFEDGYEFSICDADYGSELAAIGRRIGGLLTTACLPRTPCPACDEMELECDPYPRCGTDTGASPLAERLAVRVTDAGTTGELVPCLDYDVVPDPLCDGGFHIDFDPAGTGTVSVPPGARADFVYAYDGCAACD